MKWTTLNKVVRCKALKNKGKHSWREQHRTKVCSMCNIQEDEWELLLENTLPVKLHPTHPFTLVCPTCSSALVTPGAYNNEGKFVQMAINPGTMGMCVWCNMPFRVTEEVADKHNEPLKLTKERR